MHGIQGTEFWGFSSSYLHDAMVGGTYHNGTLLHYKDTYDKGKDDKGGWFAGGAGDATKGYNHPAFGDVMFDGGGMFKVVDRTQGWNWLPFDNTKNASMNGQAGRFGNYEWQPHYYHQFYSPKDSVLYKTEDNGQSWTVVYDFLTGPIYRTRIPVANPDIILTVHNDVSTVRLMKSTDAGATFTDISPPSTLVGDNNWRNKLFDIDQKNPNNIWLLLAGGGTNYKVFKTTDGGLNWVDWTGDNLSDETVLDIVHHQGSDGGVYVGTTHAVYYRNNTMDDWSLYNDNLPLGSRCGYLYPYYSEGKIRLGTYTGAYQVDLFENVPPVVKPAVDKAFSECPRDTFYFKDLSYLDRNGATWLWTFPGATYVSSTTIADPKVVYATPGIYDVTLRVTDASGQSDERELVGMVEQMGAPAGCINDCNNLSLNKMSVASSIEAPSVPNTYAFDGNLNTRWASNYTDDEWIYVDLGAVRSICSVRLYWETALGRDFNIEVSDDMMTWTPIVEIQDNESFINIFEDLEGQGRYVRMLGIERGSPYGYSLWEFEVFSEPLDVTSTHELSGQNSLTLYPNPADDYISLSFNAQRDMTTKVYIYDVSGKLFRAKDTSFTKGKNEILLDLHTLPTGQYYIRVMNTIRSFIKQE